jgi:hypothetical protein
MNSSKRLPSASNPGWISLDKAIQKIKPSRLIVT